MAFQSTVASKDFMSAKGIQTSVRKSETKALQRYGVDNYNLLELDEVLNDVYDSCKPISADYVSRKDLVYCLNNMAREIYGFSGDVPVLEAYGSFVMDMFSPQSDLDISINFSTRRSELSRGQKLKILQRFATKLRYLEGTGHVMHVESIFSARVPIVKFLDRGTGVECDLSVENRDGILKSQLIHIISQIDERFQKLCILMKSWAKTQGINSSRDHTLSSLAIISLVAFHLQTREPPILPPFSVLFKDGTNPPSVVKTIQTFLERRQQNKESLGRLFVTLLIKLQSVEHLWDRGLCISVLNGLWIKKPTKNIGSITIEDFSDKSQNVSRAVKDEGFKKVYSSIHKSVECLVDFFNGQTAGSHLKHTLFGAGQVVEPPPVPHAVYPQPQDHIDEFHDRLQHREYRNGRLTDGYRAVEAGNWREMESCDWFSGKRARYAESYIAPETSHHHYHRRHYHHTPHFTMGNHLDDDPYSRVPLHGRDPSGPWVPRDGPFRVEERYMSMPMSYPPVGLSEGFDPRFDGPPFHHASYGRYRPEHRFDRSF